MVNRLRLSPLAAPHSGPAADGPNPLALASFVLLAGLFLGAMGLQFFGDPYGGRPRLSVTLEVPQRESADLLRLADEGARAPSVVGEGTTAAQGQQAEVAAIDPGHIRVIPAEEASEASVTGTPAQPRFSESDISLAPAPVPALTAQGEHGPVPVIGPNGERAAEVYARPYRNRNDLPRIAVVIGGLGLNAEATRAAIERLPGEVTLSFVPYADNLQDWIDLARENGHEVILELPLEPFDYPANDPGPATLLTSNDWTDNASNLDWVMSRATGYVGLMNYQGARLTASERSFAPVLRDIADRGLLYLDDGISPRSLTRRLAPETGGPWAEANHRIDLRANEPAVNSALRRLEAAATESGVAIGVGFAYPVTVNQIVGWAETLEVKGLSLAPLSATTQSETG